MNTKKKVKKKSNGNANGFHGWTSKPATKNKYGLSVTPCEDFPNYQFKGGGTMEVPISPLEIKVSSIKELKSNCLKSLHIPQSKIITLIIEDRYRYIGSTLSYDYFSFFSHEDNKLVMLKFRGDRLISWISQKRFWLDYWKVGRVFRQTLRELGRTEMDVLRYKIWIEDTFVLSFHSNLKTLRDKFNPSFVDLIKSKYEQKSGKLLKGYFIHLKVKEYKKDSPIRVDVQNPVAS